jgi:hypothetical protein
MGDPSIVTRLPEHLSRAEKSGIEKLYKFMPYPPVHSNSQGEGAELRRRVDALLTQGELYFPTASQLNDPFELTPHIHLKQDTEALGEIVKHLPEYAQLRQITRQQRRQSSGSHPGFLFDLLYIEGFSRFRSSNVFWVRMFQV